jgi:hypothetical protein
MLTSPQQKISRRNFAKTFDENSNDRGSSSFGRASAFQAEGGRFEPGLPLQAGQSGNRLRKPM